MLETQIHVLKLIIEDDEGRKTIVPFVRDELTVGRQEGNTIRLTERNVSRRHARFSRQSGQIFIEDLGSSNGVRVNGDRIIKQAKLKMGDLIQIGDYDLAIAAEDSHSAKTIPLEAMSRDIAPRRIPSDATATLPAIPLVELSRDDDDSTATSGDDLQTTVPMTVSAAELEARGVPVAPQRKIERPRLVVLNTDMAGREYQCSGDALKIGRTEENDIVIDHRSLSRSHCKLVREASGEWRIIDLQSANGLMVNSEPYRQASLRSGDEIELGHVVLKFLMPGDPSPAIKRRTQPTPPVVEDDEIDETLLSRAKAQVIAFLLALAVVCIGIGGYLYWKRSRVLVPELAVAPAIPPAIVQPPPRPVDQAALDRDRIDSKRADAEAAMRSGEWDLAEKLLNECQINGNIDARAQELLGVVTRERDFKIALDSAGDFLAQGHLEKAKTQLALAQTTVYSRARHAELLAKHGKLVSASQTPPERKTSAEARTSPKGPDADTLFKEAAELMKRQEYQGARQLLEKCVKLHPNYHPCYRNLGSAHARIATQESSQADMEKARFYYEKYLQVAPANDEYVPKVQKILDQARSQTP